MDARLHRALRDAERLGDLAVRLPLDVVEDDRHPEAGRQLEQRLLDPLLDLAAGSGVLGVAMGRGQIEARLLVARQRLLAGALAPERAPAVQRRIRSHAVDEG